MKMLSRCLGNGYFKTVKQQNQIRENFQVNSQKISKADLLNATEKMSL